MTHVINTSASSYARTKAAKFYMIEIVTYDGDSFTVEVEAHSEAEAQELAAADYDNVDYTMVQGCY